MHEIGNNDLPLDASALFFSLGRHALLACLTALGVQPGQQVLMPAFMCRECLAPLTMMGATPVFYDVDEHLCPLELPVTPAPMAIIAVNYFGFPQNMAPFKAFSEKTGAVVIEDNAHGFLSRDEQGMLLGSRSDFGIFSLRKTFPLPDGSALLTNREEYRSLLPVAAPCREDRLSNGFVIKHNLRLIQNKTGIRIRTMGEQLTRRLRYMRTGSFLPQPHPRAEFEIPGVPAIHCKSLAMLNNIDTRHEISRRRELYHYIEKCLLSLDVEPIFHDLPSGTVPYGYPFRADGVAAAAAAHVARKVGLDCSRWPDLPSEIEMNAPEHYRNVWWVNFLC